MMQSDKKEDIFDKMMHLPVLRLFEPFYLKYKEALLYTFFGGLAFFLNFFLFIGIDYAFQISELVNNIICWIICVLFQFFTNRTWVFDGRVENNRQLLKQIVSFFGGRVGTLVVEEIILVIFITWLQLPSAPVKIFGQIVVIVLNYIISKTMVFKK